jgi:hypothetical protein
MPPAIDLARRYAEALSALRAVHDFDDWIGQFWCEHCPAPESVGAYRTVLGTEKAIVWHEGEDTVYGYLPGYDGCFCVPADLPLPDFTFVSGQLEIPYGQDIVISAAMGEQLHPPES